LLPWLLRWLLTRLLTTLSWLLGRWLNWLCRLRRRVRDRYDDLVEIRITRSITNAYSDRARSWTSREHPGVAIDPATKRITAD
jgi:hypothetical protein